MAKTTDKKDKPHRAVARGTTRGHLCMPWANNADKKPYVSLHSCLRLSRIVLHMPHFIWRHVPMFSLTGRRIYPTSWQFFDFFRPDKIPFSTDELHRYFPPESDAHAHHKWLQTYLATNPDGSHNPDFNEIPLQPHEDNHHDPPIHLPQPWQPLTPPALDKNTQLAVARSIKKTLANRHGLIEEPWKLPVRPDQEDIANRIVSHVFRKSKKAGTEAEADAWEAEVTENWMRWWLGDGGDI